MKETWVSMQKDDFDLQTSEERYRLLVEHSPDAIAVQRDDKIIYANRACVYLLGAETAEQIIGRAVWEFVPSKEWEVVRSQYRMMSEQKERVPPIELTFLRLDGTLIEAEVMVAPFVYQNRSAILAVLRDISERKKAEAEIRQRNKELAALNAIANSISQSLDLNYMIDHALDVVLSLDVLGEGAFGILFLLDKKSTQLSLVAHRGAPVGHPCLLNPPQVGECLCGLAAQTGEVFVSHSCWEDERHTRRWAGMPAHKDISLPLVVRGKILGALDLRLPPVREITQADLELLKSIAGQISLAIENAQLRELRERAIVEERERIARELHDGLSQLLGYVNTKAMAVRLMLLNQQYEAANQNLQQLENAARGLFIDVRSAILGLKMAGKRDVSLAVNLNEYATQFSRLSGLPVELDLAPGVEQLRFGVEQELQLFRIVQEALNNVHRHASASEAWLKMDLEGGDLVLEIIDDGVGFDAERMRSNNHLHFGLSMMQERAEAIGATMEIKTAVDRGTRVSIRLRVRES